MPNGTTNMLNGHKTNLVSVIALGLLGGIGMTSGWQGIINQAPAIIAILLPVIAMTLHHAIKHYGLENQATAITEILAGIHDLNLGPISQVAGDADEVLEKALAPDTPAASVDDARPKVKK